MMNKPTTGSTGVFETGDVASAPFAEVPFVAAAVPIFSFSLDAGRLTTLVWVCGVPGCGVGESAVRSGPGRPLGG